MKFDENLLSKNKVLTIIFSLRIPIQIWLKRLTIRNQIHQHKIEFPLYVQLIQNSKQRKSSFNMYIVHTCAH